MIGNHLRLPFRHGDEKILEQNVLFVKSRAAVGVDVARQPTHVGFIG